MSDEKPREKGVLEDLADVFFPGETLGGVLRKLETGLEELKRRRGGGGTGPRAWGAGRTIDVKAEPAPDEGGGKQEEK